MHVLDVPFFVLVRAHGPESKKDEPRSGAGTSEKLYANYVSIGFYDYGQAAKGD